MVLPEQRAFPRINVEMRVHLLLPDGTDTLLFSNDWSPSGVFLRSRRIVPVGTKVTLSVVLSGLPQPLKWPAVVTRTVEEGDPAHGRPPGVALMFHRLPRPLEDFLIAEHRRAELHRTEVAIELENSDPGPPLEIVVGNEEVLPSEEGFGAPGTVMRRGAVVEGELTGESDPVPLNDPETAAALLLHEAPPDDAPPADEADVPIALAPGETGLDGAFVPPIDVVRPILVAGGRREERTRLAVHLDGHGYDVAVADATEDALRLVEHGLAPEAYIVFEDAAAPVAMSLRHSLGPRPGMPPPKLVVVLGDAPEGLGGHVKHPILLLPRDTAPADVLHLVQQVLHGPADDEQEIPLVLS